MKDAPVKDNRIKSILLVYVVSVSVLMLIKLCFVFMEYKPVGNINGAIIVPWMMIFPFSLFFVSNTYNREMWEYLTDRYPERFKKNDWMFGRPTSTEGLWLFRHGRTDIKDDPAINSFIRRARILFWMIMLLFASNTIWVIVFYLW